MYICKRNDERRGQNSVHFFVKKDSKGSLKITFTFTLRRIAAFNNDEYTVACQFLDMTEITDISQYLKID